MVNGVFSTINVVKEYVVLLINWWNSSLHSWGTKVSTLEAKDSSSMPRSRLMNSFLSIKEWCNTYFKQVVSISKSESLWLVLDCYLIGTWVAHKKPVSVIQIFLKKKRKICWYILWSLSPYGRTRWRAKAYI